jgi:hypothetical protein
MRESNQKPQFTEILGNFLIQLKNKNKKSIAMLVSLVFLVFLIIISVKAIYNRSSSQNSSGSTTESVVDDNGSATDALSNETSADNEQNEKEQQEKNAALSKYSKLVLDYNSSIANYNEKCSEYNDLLSALQDQNTKLENDIHAAEVAAADTRTPYDSKTKSNLRIAIRAAQEKIIELPETKSQKDPIVAEYTEETPLEGIDASKLNAINTDLEKELETLDTEIAEIQQAIDTLPDIPDNSELSESLLTCAGEYLDSIAVFEQVSNPDEAFIIDRLERVKEITGMQAVTEQHDPNKHLNQPGWYTSCVYFTVSDIDSASIEGDDIIDKGTLAGGSIEVYKTVQDAKNREKYLSEYDDTLLSPGSRFIVGTILIRTSRKLTYDQQVDLTIAIANEFTRLD